MKCSDNKDITSNIKAFPEIRNLSDDELAFLISKLARTNEQVDKVKSIFEANFPKKISIEAINKVRKLYRTKIKSLKEKLKKDVSRIPLGSERMQLKYLQEILDEAMDPENFLRWERCGPEEWDEVKGKDKELALRVIRTANMITSGLELRAFEKLKIELKKEAGPGRGAPGANDPVVPDSTEADDEDNATQVDDEAIEFTGEAYAV